jgi:hypothetical protein
MLRDALADGSRAVYRAHHANVVARRDASVCASKALERQRLRRVAGGFEVAAERLIASERAHR